MPTGYTSDLPKTFPEFALRCARAFGATIEMCDLPLSAPLPKEFKPGTYHAKEIQRLRQELTETTRWTLDDSERAAEAAYQKELRAWKRRRKETEELRQRYLAMLAEVKQWLPPTKHHVEMKRFMREQLEQSLKFDCSNEYDEKPTRVFGPAYKAERLKSLRADIDYNTERDIAEHERAAERTKWVCDLRESLAKWTT